MRVPLAFFAAMLLGLSPLSARADRSLEEVIVTAQMREQDKQDVPISLSAFDSNALEQRSVLDIKDLAHVAPELEVQSGTEAIRVSYRIRRVGNLSSIPTFEPEVGVFVDGAFRSRTFYGAMDMLDIDRVEILRGPQMALYGKNATAGVIGFYSKKPQADFAARAELTGGAVEGVDTTALYSFRGIAEGSLGDGVRGSFAVGYRGHGHTDKTALSGYSAELNDQSRLALRGQLYWQVEDTEVRLLVGYGSEDDDVQDGDLYYDPNGWVANRILPALRAAGISSACASNDYRDHKSCVRSAIHSDLDARDATLLIDRTVFENWQLASITSWDWFRFEGRWDDAVQVGAPLLRFHDTQRGDSLQQQLRLSSPVDEKIEWLFGAMVYRNRFHYGDSDRPMFLYDMQSDNPAVVAINDAVLGAPLPFATPGQLGIFRSSQDADYLSGFSQTTWHIDSAAAITAALRWQRERKTMHLNNAVNDPSPSFISLILAPENVNGREHLQSEGSSWSLTPQYRLGDFANLYATAAQGIKSGGFNTGFGKLPLDQRQYDDEWVTHYEAGVKSMAFAGKLRWSFDVFHTEIEHFQDAAFVGAQYRVVNAERADLDGIELEAEAAPISQLMLDAQISYADFRYGKNTHGQCHPLQAPDSPTDSGACDLSGKHPINAPLWKTHMGATLEQPQAAFKLYERIDWAWSSSYNPSFSNDPQLAQGAYSWINLRAGIRWSRCDVSLWINNAFDAAVVDVAAVQNIYAGPGDGSVQAGLEEGRSYGVTLSIAFQ